MHYHITAISDARSDPEHYQGVFLPWCGDHPLIRALVIEFGDPDKRATDCLQEWSCGYVDLWLAELDDDQLEYEICVDGTHYHITIGDES
ncbi:MAG: hypothetical protein HQ582_33250 [Planctomycetes bacterium]|nr:hypothetical protein [Planctomycetota bacterium]